MLEVPGKPELDTAFGLLGVGFERVGEGVDEINFHFFVSGADSCVTDAIILLNSASTFLAKSVCI